MRLIPLVAAACVLCLSGSSFAQEWVEYVSREDFFTVNFPAQPTVREIMHDNRLYILEGTVSADSPPPGLFQQSLGFIDRQGIRVRYQSIYSNMYPPPSRVQYQVPQDQGQPR